MRFHRLDLNLLVALDALLTHRHVTRAAERLCLSQSAMSGSLARLRVHFKDDLIVQVGRKMILTPLGETIARPLRELLAQTESLINTAPRFGPASSDRTFTIIMSDSEKHVPKASKAEVATAILDAVLSRRSSSDMKVPR